MSSPLRVIAHGGNRILADHRAQQARSCRRRCADHRTHLPGSACRDAAKRLSAPILEVDVVDVQHRLSSPNTFATRSFVEPWSMVPSASTVPFVQACHLTPSALTKVMSARRP